MATPNVVPTSRVVSFMAEPMPALSRGTDDMISSVNGLIVNPMPIAIGEHAGQHVAVAGLRRRGG